VTVLRPRPGSQQAARRVFDPKKWRPAAKNETRIAVNVNRQADARAIAERPDGPYRDANLLLDLQGRTGPDRRGTVAIG